MLNIPNLIQETQELLQNDQIGKCSHITAVIQQCPLPAAYRGNKYCEVRTVLQRNQQPATSASMQLDPSLLVACAEDLIKCLSIGIPIPLLKKVQSFLLCPFPMQELQTYDLFVALALPDNNTPYQYFNQKG